MFSNIPRLAGFADSWRMAYTPRTLKAHVDFIDPQSVCGWVFDRRWPLRRLAVRVRIGSRIFGPSIADIFRVDVHRAHADSDGYCGFKIPCFGDANAEGAVVEVEFDGDTVVLGKKNARYGSLDVKDLIRPHKVGDFFFFLDPRRDQVSGWLSSIPEPSRRLRLLLEAGNRVVSEMPACLHRASTLRGDDFHGFQFPLQKPETSRFRLIEVQTGEVLHPRRWLR